MCAIWPLIYNSHLVISFIALFQLLKKQELEAQKLAKQKEKERRQLEKEMRLVEKEKEKLEKEEERKEKERLKQEKKDQEEKERLQKLKEKEEQKKQKQMLLEYVFSYGYLPLYSHIHNKNIFAYILLENKYYNL